MSSSFTVLSIYKRLMIKGTPFHLKLAEDLRKPHEEKLKYELNLIKRQYGKKEEPK